MEKKKKTEIQTAIEELSVFIVTKPADKTEATHIPLRPILSFCSLIIQVLGIFISSFRRKLYYFD